MLDMPHVNLPDAGFLFALVSRKVRRSVWRTARMGRLFSGSPGTMARPLSPPPVCHPARVSSRRPPFCLVSYFQQLDRSGRGYSHTTSPCLLPRPPSCFDFFVVSESIPVSGCLGGKALLEASHTFKPVEPLAISRLGGYSSVGRASRSQ